MIIDVVAVLPSLYVLVVAAADWMDETAGGSTDGSSELQLGWALQHGAFRLVKALRLMYDGTFTKLIAKLDQETTAELQLRAPAWTRAPQVLVKAFNSLLCVFCITHVLGCLWYSVGSNNDTLSGGQRVQGWVAQEGWEDEVDVGTRWLRSFYWGATTITTIGYGDIVASTNSEMRFTLATQVLGVICNAVLIATVCKIFDQGSKVQDDHDNYRSDMMQWMQKKKVSHDLQVRSLRFMDHLNEVEINFDVPALLKKLPPAIEFDLLEHISIRHLRSADLCEGFPDDVLVDLARALVPYPVTEGQVIFKVNDKARETYLVVSGHEGHPAQIRLDNPSPLGGWNGVETDVKPRHIVLGEGEFFGENALDFRDNVNVYRTQRATAITGAELLLLPANFVEDVADGYPGLKKAVKKFKEMRQAQLEEGTALGMHHFILQRKKQAMKDKMRAFTRFRGLGEKAKLVSSVGSPARQQPQLEPEPEPEMDEYVDESVESDESEEPENAVEARLTAQDTRLEKLEQQQDLILQKLDELLRSQEPLTAQRTGSASASI